MIDISGLTDKQRQEFMTEVLSRRQNIVTVMLLTFFLGGVGAHKFYFKEYKSGMLYLLFCWTFIPSLIAIFQLPVVKKRTEEYNNKLAAEVFAKVNSIK